MPKKKKKKHKLKLRSTTKLFLAFIIVLIVYFSYLHKSDIRMKLSKLNIINPIKLHKERTTKYNECINNPLIEENFNEETLAKKEEIINYAQNNGLRYTYEDLTYGYQINYNENSPVYGASLIKLVDAIYLIDNDVDLTKKVKYTSNFVSDFSEGMQKHKIGEKVSLHDLMKYAITVSDNAAHHMLVSYIGKSNLKKYANSLGATAIFTGSSDDFGNQTSHDMNIYLKKAYELMNSKENGKYLKEYMLNNRRNNLNVENVVTLGHKYGSINNYFHDVGINFDNHPYTISVLTTKGYTAGPKYINKLSQLTKEFNDLYYTNKETYCKDYSLKKD